MDKQAREDTTTWIPQTPIKPITPIYPDQNQTEEERLFVGNRDKSGLDHLSFGDLLALANRASSVFLSRQIGIDKEHVIKTPEKPKRKKHRPKVVREAKPKRDPKPKTPKKPAAAAAVEEGQESKTPKRKYVRKKKEEADEGQEEYTPVDESAAAGEASARGKKACRRTLSFEDDSFKPENGETQHGDEKGSASREKHDQDLQDCYMVVPSTPKRKRSSQPRRMGKEEPVKNSEAQATRRRQGKEPNNEIYLSGRQYEAVFEYYTNEEQILSFHRQQLVTQDFYSFASQSSAGSVLTYQGRQSFESMDKIDTPTKKRTTGHARVRGFSSMTQATQVSEQSQQNNSNVLAKTPSRKKRTTKSQKSQTNHLALLPNNHCQYPPSFAAGLSPDEIWRQRYSIEAISELMRLLDINREYSETALVPYAMNSSYSIGNQIVLFNGGASGAIVPSTRVKKPRRERAKVHIDNETDRVWKLLMENIDSEGVDGSDEKKAKWWEEERNVFRGRADSFIARMHLVQGDRRFTPWKGSVVDSVVGVFLTQNVSDHLSSSAFMSLAAEYPAPVVPSSDFEVGTCSMPSIRITYLDSDEPISNPPVPSEVSAALNITQPEEKDHYVNSNDASRSSSEIASSGNESVFKTMEAQVGLDRTGSSMEVSKTDQMFLVQELFPSEDSVLTSQKSLVSETPQSTERAGSSSEINSEAEHGTSFVKLLESQGSAQIQEKERDVITADTTVLLEEANQKTQCSSSPGSLHVSSNTSPGDCCSSVVKDFKSLKGKAKCTDDEPCCFFGDVLSVQKPEIPESSTSTKLVIETPIPDINESTNCLDVQEGTEKQQPGPGSSSKEINPMDKATFNAKGKKILKEVNEEFDWDSLRREAQAREGIREKTARSLDSVDWEAIRTADVNEVAETIKSRGMNHKLAERIQGFLNRLLTDHGSLDLEWLRDVPPDKAKEYLLSFNGLGLKSVECVRLLTLHHLAFPVDTNVGRIAVRLGWVPLQPLPESLQLHLLEMYPVLESIQKYLWPRLCKFDQKTLYELHYQMITFGKVFCTKSKPNCNACPMRGECRHFASAFASARLTLPGPEKGMETPDLSLRSLPEPLRRQQGLEVVNHSEEAAANRVASCEPIIEEPASPEPECAEVSIADIEDAFYEDPEEIPTIRLNMDAFTDNLKKIFEHSKELQEVNMSGALVALTAEAASLPMPKLKNISQLRTEHQVYELYDNHPLLAKFEKRETDDPCSYLLAIWTPGETVDSIKPARSKCIWQEAGKMCDEPSCFSCNNIRETQSQTVRGTILVPCRTAMRGSFPLNGTYFQVNEVFADHESSLTPIDVPRELLWDLARRTVYFGTSIPTIFKGLSTEAIQQCFWRGYVCVRGFDRKTRGPKPLIARLHFPKSKMKSQINPDDA